MGGDSLTQQGLYDPMGSACVGALRFLPNTRPVDEARRIVTRDKIFRYWWELRYRDGDFRNQYEMLGSAIIQTMFGRVDPQGVQKIIVRDAFNMRRVVIDLDVPEGAEAVIILNRSMEADSGVITTIQTFGWRFPGEHKRCLYIHLDPRTDPPRVMNSKRRLL